MCCQERTCFAHWSQAWQRCDTAHVFEGFTRVFLSLIHVQPAIRLCVSMCRQEETLLFKNVSFIQQLRIIFLWPPFDEWEYTERRDYCELSYKAGTHSFSCGHPLMSESTLKGEIIVNCHIKLAHTCLVRDLFHMLHRLTRTVSLAKLGHQTLSALKSYFFKLS